MGPYQQLLAKLPAVEEKIHYTFRDKSLLALAFVHTSFYNEYRQEVALPNERLEFLGDAVLGLLIAEYLYERFPEAPEGFLASLQASLVEEAMCSCFARHLDLSSFLLLGKGEQRNRGAERESIQADLLEALLAAVYLDGGLEQVKTFFWSHFTEEIERALREPTRNWKAELQELLQKNYQTLPTYQLLQEYGPDHSKVFIIGVMFKGKLLGRGEGGSKKEAEQLAAKQALQTLQS
ncbi:MAG: ribonuclease III [Chlamydiae bacterium]|nr:ribonuclease III [Chlamydiota bacterium]